MSPVSSLILLLHVAATLAMFGVIWFVQVVHYPLMADVGAAGFQNYEATHMSLTTLVVAPLMLVEFATALLLVAGVAGKPVTGWWIGLALLGVIWVSTFALQVPAHAKLTQGFDAVAHARLVGTNWIRTLAWTARAALVLWFAARQLRGG
jgi:hypothetical protein